MRLDAEMHQAPVESYTFAQQVVGLPSGFRFLTPACWCTGWSRAGCARRIRSLLVAGGPIRFLVRRFLD
jgi:hypothetical protein